MYDDFLIFFGLLVFSLVGSGVAMYAIAQPWRGIDKGTTVDILYKPMFQVFGELFLEEMFGDTGCASTTGEAWRSCNFNWYYFLPPAVEFEAFSGCDVLIC
jgi:hypothetical protein